MALLKIHKAFKTSPVKALELEAALPPPRIRFKKICNNYAMRIMHMNENHPIVQRIPNTFPPYYGKFQVDKSRFFDWNENPDLQEADHGENESESDFSSTEKRRKRKSKRKKSRKKIKS